MMSRTAFLRLPYSLARKYTTRKSWIRSPYEVDSFYIFDRAYMDTKQLYAIDKVGAFFVVREKQRMVYEVVEDKRYNNPKTGVMSDTMIMLTGQKTKKQ